MPELIDLVVVPYHDWRKVQREGGRTRDAHIIRHAMNHPGVRRVVIVNRPMSLAEMVVRKQSWKTAGETIRRTSTSCLSQIADNGWVIDFLSADLLGPVVKRKGWFSEAFASDRFLDTVAGFLSYLQIERPACLCFNVYAAQMIARLEAEVKLFDAWDNFLKFPSNAPWFDQLKEGYRTLGEVCDLFSTNSSSNRSFYEEQFGYADCRVIRNGVDVETFQKEYETPWDLMRIKRPIVGIGAKVTHLLDVDLLNDLTRSNPDLSFVLVGQIIDKGLFERVQPRLNFHYLGDKHYDHYPAYVASFDVCAIPYVTGLSEHGGDSIKFYEYLAAKKPVVTTPIEGVNDDIGLVKLAKEASDFSAAIRTCLDSATPDYELPESVTWKYKTGQLLRPLLERIHEPHRGTFSQ